jgi:hypothetical protein
MNGELAQCVVLTSFGSAYLHAPNPSQITEAIADHGTFQHVKAIQFGNATPDPGPVAFRKWITSLKRQNSKRLWLVESGQSSGIEPHIAEAFANADPRGILVERVDQGEIWLPNWHFTRGSKWLVRYEPFPTDVRPTKLSVTSTTRQLRAAIEIARDFAARIDHTDWVRWFTKALTKFDDATDTFDFLPPFGYPAEARRLLSAASGAWVFGGMGWWNDMSFSDSSQQQQYDTVTEQLYDAVCRGILAATNAFDPSGNGN